MPSGDFLSRERVWALMMGALVLLHAMIALYSRGLSGLLFESSPFAADCSKHLSGLWLDHSLWLWGQHSITTANYAPLYGLLATLELVLGSSWLAYLALICAAQVSAYVATSLLAREAARWDCPAGDDRPLSQAGYVAWVIGAIYVASLANFNYLKSNALFALPYYLLPLQLWLARRYVLGNDTRYLLGASLIALLTNSFNITIFFYVQGTVFLAIAYWRIVSNRRGTRLLGVVRDVIKYGITVAPTLLLHFAAIVVNAPYYAELGELSRIMAEEMYSQNASLLNTFQLTTDWGLWGWFEGEPYYEFGGYYLNPVLSGIVLACFAAAFLLSFGGIRQMHASRAFPLAWFWLAILVACVFFQLGSRNPAFSFLYDNFLIFKVFRNITKLTPLLLLSVLMILAARIGHWHEVRFARWLFVGIAAGMLSYSLPYWTYASYFYKDRFANRIPQYWSEAGAFVDSVAPPGARALLLPPIYINDVYLWESKKVWVQGTLPDAIWRTQTVRLSETLVGPPSMQSEMRAVFERGEGNERKLVPNMDALLALIERHGYRYVVVTKDLVSEYQPVAGMENRLVAGGLTKRAEFGPLVVLEAPSDPVARIRSSHAFEYDRVDNLTYLVKLRGVGAESVVLDLAEPFRPGWRLADANGMTVSGCGDNCRKQPLFSHLLDFRAASLPAAAAARHLATDTGENRWVLAPASRTGSRPTDDSAGVAKEMTLLIHFRPQLLFVAVFWCLVGSLVAAVLVLGVGGAMFKRPRA